MARDLNRVEILGRLGQSPELRYMPSGQPVVTFSVATSRQWKDAQGEKQEETTWHNCVAYGPSAETINTYLDKGSRVWLDGRLHTRSWEDRDTGEKRYKVEIVVASFIFLDGVKGKAERPAPDVGDEDPPF